MSYGVLDVANRLLQMSEASEGQELMTNLKLQKMLYYQQGFHLAYFDAPLFEEEIEAWMYGPAVPCVYERYRANGKIGIPSEHSSFEFENPVEESLFEEVFRVYGAYSAMGLIEKTHSEPPWRNTPTGVGNVIPKGAIKAFFKTRLRD